jgi:hypothetical protein
MSKYKFKAHAGWNDKTTWLTLAFMFIYFTAAGVWAFNG